MPRLSAVLPGIDLIALFTFQIDRSSRFQRGNHNLVQVENLATVGTHFLAIDRLCEYFLPKIQAVRYAGVCALLGVRRSVQVTGLPATRLRRRGRISLFPAVLDGFGRLATIK